MAGAVDLFIQNLLDTAEARAVRATQDTLTQRRALDSGQAPRVVTEDGNVFRLGDDLDDEPLGEDFLTLAG